jgi:hypothetical protein
LELNGLDRALTVGAAVPTPAGDGAPRSWLGGQRIGRRGRFKAQIDIAAGTCAEHVTITTDGIRLLGQGATLVPADEHPASACSFAKRASTASARSASSTSQTRGVHRW